MNTRLSQVLAALSMLATLGAALGDAANESGAGQSAQPPSAPELAAPAQKAEGRDQPAAEAPAPEDQGTTGQTEPSAESAGETTGEKASAAEGPAAPEKAAEEKEPEPVTGAFGIKLGERFEPCMVAKVLAEEEKTYRAANKTERKGTLYRVEPRLPNKLFTSYAVETTSDGMVYSIRAEFQAEDKASKCDVAKRLAEHLQEKYGKPRGKDSFGNWYAFRDMSLDHYRGIRLYANRCRRGIYSIHYSDDNARTADAPPPPEVTETSGL
jgi:hypothetical protein